MVHYVLMLHDPEPRMCPDRYYAFRGLLSHGLVWVAGLDNATVFSSESEAVGSWTNGAAIAVPLIQAILDDIGI